MSDNSETPRDDAVFFEGSTLENIDEKVRLWQEDRVRRVNAIRQDGYSVGRAMMAWGEVRSDEDWKTAQRKAEDGYESGRFLIDQLGAEHYLDPGLMATLWLLRQRLLEQFNARGPADSMLIDLFIIGYYNTLRIQRWIGDSASSTEYELFGRDAPSVKLKQNGYAVTGLRVEDLIEGLVQRLYPLLDRSNRMALRNLRALRELRTTAAPAVSIAQAAQVNVGAQQENTFKGNARTERVPPTSDSARTRRSRRKPG